MQLADPQPFLINQQPAAEALLERLLEFAQAKHAPPCIRVRAKGAHSLSAVNIDTPLLAILLQGRKRVRDTQRWIHIAPGEIFLVPQAAAIDIENIPDPSSGLYLAIGIPLEEHVLNAARQLIREPVSGKRTGVACVPLNDHIEDFTRWLDALECNELPRACNSMVGVVLRLYAQGHRSLLLPSVPSLAAQIRTMISADPKRPWSSADVETALALSGATLRRRLALENISLRELIVDARLSHGLALLLTTRLPVKSVAARVGYASVSSFIKRFSDRYGVEPSRINAS